MSLQTERSQTILNILFKIYNLLSVMVSSDGRSLLLLIILVFYDVEFYGILSVSV